MFDELHEECGVFGAYRCPDAASLTYYGLHSLQHRGQEASGIASSDHGRIQVIKGRGLTIDVFSLHDLEQLPGDTAIGHVRYSTAGGQEYENIQPMTAQSLQGDIALVHNGQIVNDQELRRELEQAGAIFQGTSDSEVILHLIERQKGSLKERVRAAAARLEGAFSILVMKDDEIIALRDRHGLRPLSYARHKDGYVISSESCAFEVMGLYEQTGIEPGQMVVFSRGIPLPEYYVPAERCSRHLCAMEYIYFARPDSVMEGQNVHTVRRETGRLLAAREPDLQADVVIGCPDSSLSAAMGFAEASGIPFQYGLVKNRFVTRTFIQPTQALRDRSVRMKLSPVREVIAGRRVVLIDDSIVRGTTSRRIVRLLREAGALEVHVRIASPMLQYPCFYGVDTSTREELIAADRSCQEICDFIEADSLAFLDTIDLQQAARQGLCTACFDGCYCTDLFSHAGQAD